MVGSILFTTLLCFKHIFVVFAPVVGLFVLIFTLSKSSDYFYELLIISYSCIKIVLISFLPFLIKGQFIDIIKRLFPVQRGLLHSYWAPNFWALYSCLDLALRRFFISNPHLYSKFSRNFDIPVSTLCNGLTGEKSFSILPDISPITSIILIGLFHLVSQALKTSF